MIVHRRHFLEQAGALGLLGIAGGWTVACAPSADRAAGGKGNTLTIALANEPLALSSAGSIDGGASVVGPQIFDRLFVTDLKGQAVPQLALSGVLSADGRQATITLRPDVRWHDGKPLTSTDVAYSIEHVWKALLPRSQVAFADLRRIETPSPLEVLLHFDQPAPFLLAALADGSAQVIPAHLYAGKDVLTNPANRAPVGTGPFLFESWERGQHLILRRNPDYWDKGLPHLDKLVYRFVAAGAPTSVALESGSAQYSTGVPVNDVKRFRDDPRFVVRTLGTEYSANFFGFAFNLNKPALRDRRVRQAFAYAIDRDFLVRNIWQGLADAADSPIPRGSEWHAPELPQYAVDLAKANALLDEAGLKPGPDGVRLTLYNDVMPPASLYPRAAQFIRQCLSKIGIRLELRSEELATYLRRVFTDRDWDTITFGTGSDFDPVLGIQRFYTSASIKPGVPFSNATHYATPEVDGLFKAAQGETDIAQRKALYNRIQTILQTDLPTIPLLFPASTAVSVRGLDYPVKSRITSFADARLDTKKAG